MTTQTESVRATPSANPMNRNGIRILPIVLALGFILFKFIATPKYVNPETGSAHRVGMDPQQEQALGLQSYQQVLAEERANVVNSGPEVTMVKTVARRLAAAAAEKGNIQYNWQLSVVKSDQVNAFCLPGGEIVVYTAILPITQDEAGLATVLGHEMAHATSRHGAQRVFQQSIAQAAMMGAQTSLGNMDWQHQQAIMGALGAATKYGAILPFSRDHESEADHIGLLYMARAGYRSAQGDRVLAAHGADRRAAAATVRVDHPSHGTRIQQLQAWMPEAEKEYENSQMRQTKQPTQSTGM